MVVAVSVLCAQNDDDIDRRVSSKGHRTKHTVRYTCSMWSL